ncbi:MAG TPA: MFS transporter [Candidatus Eisenbacteria bacterium]|nr:MFS transporter [Candidatus Eisenbacteria bacterium]
MIRHLKARLNDVYYGWRMIAIGCAIRLLGGGFHLYGFTVFFLPITQELGLSRAATSLVFSLARIEGAIEGPFVGYLIDRFGPRPIIISAVTLSGLGYMALATVDSYYTLLAVYLGVISLAFSAGFMHSPMVLANSWFIRRRGLAMTLISSAISIGGTLITPLLALGVHTLGWRYAAFFAGAALIMVGVPLALPVRRSPESMGLRPDGASDEGEPKPAAGEPRPSFIQAREREANFTLREAMATSAFWLMVLATCGRVAAFNTITVHFVPLMVWKDVSETRAAAMLATMALVSFPMHLLLGWMADHVSKPKLMASSMLIGTAALFLLAYGRAEWCLWLFTILFTVVESVFPVGWATVGDFFGRKYFATIRGTMSAFYLWGAALGPVMAGAVYDRYQSYGPIMSILIALFLLAACFYALLKDPKRRRTVPRD